MLVLSHIFEEARYQMKLSMEMSGMTTSSREFLRNEVEDLATEAIFTVAEDNDDVELVKALISFGARPCKVSDRWFSLELFHPRLTCDHPLTVL